MMNMFWETMLEFMNIMFGFIAIGILLFLIFGKKTGKSKGRKIWNLISWFFTVTPIINQFFMLKLAIQKDDYSGVVDTMNGRIFGAITLFTIVLILNAVAMNSDK